MADRIITKEYFRKPYLVDDKADDAEKEYSDYRYMMDIDWQGHQNASYVVVQSVRKKPYLEDDYQEMEAVADGWTGIDWERSKDWYRPKFNWGQGSNIVPPIPPEEPTITHKTLTGKLRWIQPCPSSIGLSKTYTVIVKNSYVNQRTYTNGLVTRNITTYFPSDIFVMKKSDDARGLTVTRAWQVNSVTYATLETSSSARGTYYVYATDGENTISSTVTISRVPTVVFRRATSPYTYYKLGDLVRGDEIPYTVFTAQSSIVLQPDKGSLYLIPVETWITSFELHTETFATLTLLNEDALLASTYYMEETYYDSTLTITYVSVYGRLAYVSGGMRGFFPRAYSVLYNEDFTTYTGSVTENTYNYYCKFTGISLVIITAYYSKHADMVSGNDTYYYTGTDLLDYKLIDSNSYFVIGGYYSEIGASAAGTPSYYHASGEFSGSMFSINLSWQPTILFGTV